MFDCLKSSKFFCCIFRISDQELEVDWLTETLVDFDLGVEGQQTESGVLLPSEVNALYSSLIFALLACLSFGVFEYRRWRL